MKRKVYYIMVILVNGRDKRERKSHGKVEELMFISILYSGTLI
jgi:hypothetical protein